MTRFIQHLFISCIALTMGISACAAQASLPVKSIENLDLQRYMGPWFEVAKFPNWFQRKCQRNTQAIYKLQSAQQIEVLNKCTTDTNEVIQAIGTARPNGSGLPAQLEVRFAPSWMSWLPFTWGAYWVLDLDKDYQLAAVGDPSKNYLWILSRTPHVSEEAYAALIKRMAVMGFDITKLEKTLQN